MGVKMGGPSSRGGPKGRGKKAGPKGSNKSHAKQKLQQKRLRQQQGGSLPKRPDIKGLNGDGLTKKEQTKGGNKPRKDQRTKGDRRLPEGKRPDDGRPFGHKKQRGPRGRGDNAEGAPEGPRKRKLANGQERLRALLDKHPHLLHPGESAEVAVASCFKKTGRPQEEAEGDAPADQEQQQLSGSKRRKLLRLVMNSRAADDKVFVHQSYQLYNDILRSIRTAEDTQGHASQQPNKGLQSRVAKAISFLEEPLSRVCHPVLSLAPNSAVVFS